MTSGSLPVPAARLPVAPTSFVGRERELAALQVLLREPGVRLLTLTGPGGVGKTRLAAEAARTLASEFRDGVAFVSLADIADPELVATTIASALGIREAPDRPLAATLIAEIADRESLLVLDNFEQVDAAAPLLAELLRAGAALRILVTSRSLLQLGGEHHVPLSPLAVPGPEPVPIPAELAGVPAVRLFADRARAATGDFTLTADNVAPVAEICRRLDGLPLAIELAASWSRVLPPAALAARLADRLLALGGGPRDLPARQQTIRAAIAWSYDLLDIEDRALFARLGVFAGGWTLEAAEAVAMPEHADALTGLGRLIDRSLVHMQQTARDNAEPRFGMLETVREFAREQLALGDARAAIEQKHGRHFLALARESAGMLDHTAWLARLAAEHDNLRAVAERAIAARDADTALRLGSALRKYWAERGHLREGRDSLERALALAGDVDVMVRANAIYNLGNLAFDLCDLAAARTYFTEFLSLMRDAGDQNDIADARNGLGLVEFALGAYHRAREHFEATLSIWSDISDRSGIATAHFNLGHLAVAEGAYGQARVHYQEALAVDQHRTDVYGIAYSQQALATIARLSGDSAAAQTLYAESLRTFQHLGARQGEAVVLCGLGLLASQTGDDLEALRLLRDALILHRSLPDYDWTVKCIEGIAAVVVDRGYLEQAVRLLGAVMPLRATAVAAATFAERQEQERVLSAARRTLTESAFAAAWDTGRALSLEQAAAEAQQLAERSDVIPRPAAPFTLTRREREVLTLLCQYLTDAEIAERLFLSPRTASNHVASIFSKLGLSNRRDVVAFATRHGLV